MSCVAAVPAFAQSELSGKDQFPEFRTLSGLVGGGFGVKLDGSPSFGGAMALSTPIGPSLGPGRFAFAAGSTSDNHTLRFFNTSRSNGTLSGMFGIGSPIGNLTVGGMVLSSLGDNVLNLQFSPRLNTPDFSLGIGVQDVFSTGGSNGQAIDNATGGGNSRSIYAVGTTKFAEGGYVSFGIGTRRFRNGFSNVSYNVVPFLKGIAEYDGFNWNYGVGVNLGSFNIGSASNGDTERKLNATGFLGLVRGKYPTWTLSLSF